MNEMEKFKARQETEERIANGKEERNRQIRRRTLKMAILNASIVLAIVSGVLIKNYKETHISPQTIITESNIHNNTRIYEDGLGHIVTIDNEQGCAVPYDGITEFPDRLINKMQTDGRYTEEDMEFIRDVNKRLYNADGTQIQEINAELEDWKKTFSFNSRLR